MQQRSHPRPLHGRYARQARPGIDARNDEEPSVAPAAACAGEAGAAYQAERVTQKASAAPGSWIQPPCSRRQIVLPALALST